MSKKSNKDEECQNLLKDDSGCKFFKNVNKLFSMQSSHFLLVGAVQLSCVQIWLHCCWVYFLTQMSFLSIVFCPQVHDIEDLAKVGKDHKACPYYAATHFAGAVSIDHIILW